MTQDAYKPTTATPIMIQGPGDGAEQTCRTCRWHGQTSHSCYQLGSPHATEQTADDTSCEYWEGITNRENLRKEVEEQLG